MTAPESQAIQMLQSPIALFIFNRPQTTERVLRAIAQARPKRLLVVADGARSDRLGEAALCRQTRDLIESIDWPCEVLTHYSEVNLGCKRRIASGLDWVFSMTDAAIILEDDCLPDASFFPFCDEMLERYRHDERVHMVRGSNLLFGKRFSSSSYYFSRFYNIWGWATWARAWQHYDVEMRQWPALRDSGWLERTLGATNLARLVRYFFDETHAGRLNTWDYQWTLAGWLHNALAVVPETNLVTNIGYGEAATHLRNKDHLADLPTSAIMFPLQHPPQVELLPEADQHEWTSVYPAQVRKQWLIGRLHKRLLGLWRVR